MNNIKTKFTKNIIYVVLDFYDKENDVGGSYLYSFKPQDYKTFVLNEKTLEIDKPKLKSFLIDHRLDTMYYPYTKEELMEMSTICIATSIVYEVKSLS